MELRGQEEDSEGDDFLPNHRRLDHLGHLYAEPELPVSTPNPLPSAFRRPLLFPSPLSSSPAPPPAGPSADPRPRPPPTAAARYRECQKNHAARAGGHVLDGCGEFMPGGDEGTAEALKCAACGCHRSFHRKEPDGGADGDALFFPASAPRYFIPPAPFTLQTPFAAAVRQKRGGEEENNYSGGTTTTESSSEEMRQQMAAGAARKRHRTKFTAGQKEMMAEFAERVGWRMQKQDEGAVERFCREAGVSRQVFKVWMHNNKQHGGKGRPRGAREESPAARQQAAEGEEQGLRLPQKPSSSSS